MEAKEVRAYCNNQTPHVSSGTVPDTPNSDVSNQGTISKMYRLARPDK